MSLKNEKENTKNLKKERAELMEKTTVLKIEIDELKSSKISMPAPAPLPVGPTVKEKDL